MKIFLNISDLAVITGHNKFKNINEYIIQLWDKYFHDDCQEYLAKKNIKVKKNDYEAVMKASTDNKIDIQEEIRKLDKVKDSNELESNKKRLFEKMDKIEDPEIRKEIKKNIESLTNTRYGISGEKDILQFCSETMGRKIVKDDIYRKKKIYTGKMEWYIGGKIDGKDSGDGAIIEIKNRVHKLFLELRDYEKIQIMSYLYLHGANQGYLIEAMKNESGKNINIIDVKYDEKFFNEIILQSVIHFIRFFENLIENNEAKMSFINAFKN